MTDYNEQEINGKTSAMVAVSRQLAITDDKSLAYGLNILAQAKTTRKEIEAWWKPICEDAHRAHKTATQRKADTLRPVENIIKEIDKKATDYHMTQEIARRKEQARLDEITQKKEEAEKEKLYNQALKASRQGNEEKAEELLEQVETTFVPPMIIPEEKRVETEAGNSTFIKDIEILITDELAIHAAIGAGKIPLSCATINQAAIKRWAKMMGWRPGTYAGITIRETSRLNTRGK